jgi:hypothetical protein
VETREINRVVPPKSGDWRSHRGLRETKRQPTQRLWWTSGPRRLFLGVVSRRSAARMRSKDQLTPAHPPDIALSDCLGIPLTILAPNATTPRQTSRQCSAGLGRESAHCPSIRNEPRRGQLEAPDNLCSGQAWSGALKLSSSSSSDWRKHWLPLLSHRLVPSAR